MDGVITTEHIYWECARLTLWELLHLRLRAGRAYVNAVHDLLAREAMLPQTLVYELKNRAVNSNYDLTFVASCALLASLAGATCLGERDVEGIFYALRATAHYPAVWPEGLECFLQTAGDRRGADLIAFAGQFAREAIQSPPDFFALHGPWWEYMRERFQRWYDGTQMGAWGAAPLQEKPVVPAPLLQQTCKALRAAGYTLAVATGRPRDETLAPLKALGVLDDFALNRIVTINEVEAAQRETGQPALGKPHPYSMRRALCPLCAASTLLEGELPTDLRAVVVGDAVSDALAAQSAGMPCIGVMSGVAGARETVQAQRRAALEAAGCVAILNDLTALPGWLGAS